MMKPWMDEDPTVLMLKEEGTHQKPPTIVEAMTKLKNQAWVGAAYPMKDFVKKIKTVEPVSPTKNIVSVPIKVKSICDSIPTEFILVKSIESIKNSFPYNMISDSVYLLALNVFISKIGKETLNNKGLK